VEDNGNWKIDASDKESIEKFNADFIEILNLEFDSGIDGKLKMDWDNIKDSKNNPVLLSVSEISILENIFDLS